MEFNQFVIWVFYGVLGGSAVYAVSLLKSLNKSIGTLNVRFASFVEKAKWHELSLNELKADVDEHDKRIRLLEQRASKHNN